MQIHTVTKGLNLLQGSSRPWIEVAISQDRAEIISENYKLHGAVYYLAAIVNKYSRMCILTARGDSMLVMSSTLTWWAHLPPCLSFIISPSWTRGHTSWADGGRITGFCLRLGNVFSWGVCSKHFTWCSSCVVKTGKRAWNGFTIKIFSTW